MSGLISTPTKANELGGDLAMEAGMTPVATTTPSPSSSVARTPGSVILCSKLDLALQGAAKRGDVDGVLRLIDEGARVDATTKFAETALMLAAARGHNDVVKVLLANWASANCVDKYGKTALIHAAHGGNMEVVLQLLEPS
ncbi:ankyrin repeat-containing domain protein, partial [Ochromonadaceae sp. CCMP2298]